MKTSHSPGPWTRQGKTVYSLYQIGWSKGKPVMTNRFSLRVYPDYRLENAEEEAEATAKLIAAAPDLLEALKKAEKLLTMTMTEVQRKEIQDFLSGNFKDYIENSVLHDSIGIYAAIYKATE